MKRVICLIAAMFAAALPVYGASVVIDFEDLYDGVEVFEILPDEYGGFNWSGNTQWLTSQAVPVPESGFEYGTVGNASIVTGAENFVVKPVSMESETSFDFLGAYITAAWNIDQDFTVEGWRSDVKVYSSYKTTSYDEPHWFDFDFMDIDTLWFIPGTGGTGGGLLGKGNHLVIDDITLVPEPSSLLLLTLGGWALRKRKA